MYHVSVERLTSPIEPEETTGFLDLVAEIAVEIILRETTWETKLAQTPKGYRFEEEGFSCRIWQGAAKDGWYDKHGLKCAACQQAVDRGLIPGNITRNKDLYYTAYQLETYFGIDPKTTCRFTKARLLHPRTIGNNHLIYMTAQQRNFLPPKDLLRDSDWYQTTPDPMELIKNYGIAQYI